MAPFVVQWNANGLRPKSHWLRAPFFADAKILVFQETFLKNDMDFNLPNHKIFRNDRQHGPRGGLLIAIHNYISCQIVDFNSMSTNDVEIMGIKIYISNNEILIVNLYSPKGKFDIDWLNRLKNKITNPCIILGDFNCKHRALGADNNSSSGGILLDWIIDNNINIINTKTPTHIKPGSKPTLLDLSLCTPDLYSNLKYYVFPDTYDSDHHPVALYWTDNVNKEKVSYSINWRSFTKDINDSINSQQHKPIYDILAEALKKSKELKTKDRKVKQDPWWNSEGKKMLAKKRILLKKAKKFCDRSL